MKNLKRLGDSIGEGLSRKRNPKLNASTYAFDR